jgi:hypothetical protein
MASIGVLIAAMLLAGCSPRFDRALETRSVYDAVIRTEAVYWAGQTMNVFAETVSDGETELTPAEVARHRYRAARVYGRWLPALADYVSRRGAGQSLAGGFTAPYRLIDGADPATWPGEGPWLRFSAVGFDEHGRRAIVFVQRGGFDGDGGDGLFLMLERTEAGWRIARRDTVYVI